jgi:hypothetical protein
LIRRTLLICTACVAAPAAAQAPHVWIDGATDLRERGLSMSGGRAGVEGGIGIGTNGPTFDLSAATLRGSARLGGADLRATALAGYAASLGPGRLRAEVAYRGFAGGRGPLDYWEGAALADTLIGPLTLAAAVRYAPPQRALGGSVLYTRLSAEGGLPRSPWSLATHIGRTSGETDDPLRAARLRPDSTYLDWALGVRRVAGPALLSLTYTDTDIARTRAGIPQPLRRHAGAAIVARAGISF